MAASNRLQDLDPALLRPGRFDRQILVQQPDLRGRIAILGVHSTGKPLGTDVDLDNDCAPDVGPDRRRSREHLQRGRDQRRPHATPTSSSRQDFDYAIDRVIAGLQQRRVITDKEKRILAYHEGGHALMAHLMTGPRRCRRRRSSPAARALGYTLNLPEEERYLETKEELVDWMVVTLAGRAAEQVVFGRVTNGAANDLEKVTELARSMVFECGMGESAVSRTMRADNYALSEETKRMRDQEQSRLTDHAYARRCGSSTSTGRCSTGSRPRCSRRRRSSREGAARALRRRRARVARVRDRRGRAGPERRAPARPAVSRSAFSLLMSIEFGRRRSA